MTVHFLTTLETLKAGLLVVGYDQRNLDRVGLKKNISRFQSNYVCHPRVYADLFERLQTTQIEDGISVNTHSERSPLWTTVAYAKSTKY